MPDLPFGFDPANPGDPESVQRMLGELRQLFAGSDGAPVNWELARQVAVATLTGAQPGTLGGPLAPLLGGFGPMISGAGFGFGASGEAADPADAGSGEVAALPPEADQPVPPGNPPVDPADMVAVTEALRLADLWLEPICALPSGIATTQAWTRSEWIANTLPVWRKLFNPVAARMVSAMGDLVPEEMRGQLGPMQSMVATLGGALFGGQLGQALGSLAAEVLSVGEIGLPLGPAGAAALVPANIADYGTGLSVPADELRLYVALREAAHQRLFGHVPWLRGHMLAAVETYAAGIRVNREAIEDAISQVDPADPGSLQQLAVEGVFTQDDSPAQRSALARLETALALIEGWVCHVVDAAATPRLPDAVRLAEALRRRRAAGGPAEQAFATLVSLELRPRKLREAAAVWSALTEHRGTAGRDALWGHPDLLPTDDDFADPQAYARSQVDLGELDLSEFDLIGTDDPDRTGDDPDRTGDDPGPHDGDGSAADSGGSIRP